MTALFLSSIFLTTASAKEQYDFKSMTTYEMFWPIVAGKLPGERFYDLKIWRDRVVGSLFFSGTKKAEYLKQLANKRLVETERLLEIKRLDFFAPTLKDSLSNLQNGLNLLLASSPSQTKEWLKEEYVKDLQKYLVVLERMKEKTEKDQWQLLEESRQKVKSLLDSLT